MSEPGQPENADATSENAEARENPEARENAEPWDEMSGAVRGVKKVSERWQPVRTLVNTGALALNDGKLAKGSALLREAVAATEGEDPDPQRLDLRARAFANLAGAEEWQGDTAAALRSYEQAIIAAESCIALAADEYGTRMVIVNVLVSRAATLSQSDRIDEAFESVEASEKLLDTLDSDSDSDSDSDTDTDTDGDTDDDASADANAVQQKNHGVMRFQICNIRSTLLLLSGRLAEAEAEAHRAVSIAMSTDPALAAHAYTNLSAIAQRMGDDRSGEFLQLSADLQQQDRHGDAVTRQLTTSNLARAALAAGRTSEASAQFEEAERLALQAGLPIQAAAARTGIAAVRLQAGRIGKAISELRPLVDRLAGAGAIHELREVHQFIGDAESMRGRYARADECYLAARDLTRTSHERCRVDLRRAEMHAEWAGESPLLRTRIARLEQARDLAVPVLLATEALRDGFAPGVSRERWIARVAAPARELAFRLAMTLQDVNLLQQLIDHESASATLRSSTADAVETETADTTGRPTLLADLLQFDLSDRHDDTRDIRDLGDIRDPQNTATRDRVSNDVDEEPQLPVAAGLRSVLGTEETEVRVAPPPRVVSAPGAAPVLSHWAVIAEAEYGVRIHSEVVVASW